MGNELWTKNIESLSINHREIAEELLKYSENDCIIESGVQEIEDRSVLYAVKDGVTYQLDSLYNSDVFLNMWYEHMKNEYIEKKYLLFGIGNGMFIRKIMNECKETFTIIILEPNLDILFMVLRNFDFTDIFSDGRVKIFVNTLSSGDNTWRNFILKNTSYGDLKTMRWGEYPNYEALFPEDEICFMESIQTAVNFTNASRVASERFGKAYFENTIVNVSKLAESSSLYSLYKRLPKDVPAIIVSSGPSLNNNINYINDAKGKALIIAADSAIPALLAANIIPDLYVSVDGGKWSRHFEDERISGIPAVLCTFSSQAAVKENQKQFFIRDECEYIDIFMDVNKIEYPLLSSGGSVANICCSLAVLLDIKTIIMIGQDLAYTGGKTHAENTARADWGIDRETIAYVKDIEGNLVESSNEFIIYKEIFEDIIRQNPERKFVDATEGGALIEGTEITTLKEAIHSHCTNDYDIAEIVNGSDDLMNEEQKEAFKEYWNDIVHRMKEIIMWCNQSISNYDKMYILTKQGKHASSEMKRLQEKNNELSEKIDNNPAMSLIEYLNQESIREVYDNMYAQESNIVDEILEGIRLGRSYTESVVHNAKYVEEMIEENKI